MIRNSKQFSRRDAPYARHTPDTQKKRDVFDKCRNVLRTVYPINKSGSKIATTTLDVATFNPCVTFSKPGYIGVKLDYDSYIELMYAKNNITAYLFGNYKPPLSVVALLENLILEYTLLYKKPGINIISDRNTEYERTCQYWCGNLEIYGEHISSN
jgi:hypothetical protein